MRRRPRRRQRARRPPGRPATGGAARFACRRRANPPGPAPAWVVTAAHRAGGDGMPAVQLEYRCSPSASTCCPRCWATAGPPTSSRTSSPTPPGLRRNDNTGATTGPRLRPSDFGPAPGPVGFTHFVHPVWTAVGVPCSIPAGRGKASPRVHVLIDVADIAGHAVLPVRRPRTTIVLATTTPRRRCTTEFAVRTLPVPDALSSPPTASTSRRHLGPPQPEHLRQCVLPEVALHRLVLEDRHASDFGVVRRRPAMEVFFAGFSTCAGAGSSPRQGPQDALTVSGRCSG